jgi:hypothetical protein
VDDAAVEYITPTWLHALVWLGLLCFGLLVVAAVVGFVVFLLTRSRR